MITCTKCKDEKDESEFYKDSRRKNGLRSWCISCQKEDNRKREGSYNEMRREYRKNHKEESKSAHREYYKENKEKILSMNRNWRQTTNGRLLSYQISAKKRNVDWQLTKDEFLSFWGKNCHYCGEKIIGIGIDRIDSKNGYNMSNVVPCCYGCNIIKMDYTYQEFIERVIKIYNNLSLCNIMK